MASTKAATAATAATAASVRHDSAFLSSDNGDDMDLDPSPSPLLRTNTSADLDTDQLDEEPEYADDLVDDTTPEQAQTLLGERSKRQTLFASMFADVGAVSSLPSTASAPKAPRGKRTRRPNPDDEDFNPDDDMPVRRSTRARNSTSNYDDDDDDEYDSEVNGGSKKKKRKTFKPNANVQDLDRSELMRTYKTTSDVSHLKLPYARMPDPYPTAPNRTFGPIPGVPVGSLFYFRQDVHHAGIHRGFVAGIFGHEKFGCWSICVNGGYPEDIDEGDRIVFTGSGGRELAAKNLRTADQSCDQSPSNKCNASLIKSHATGLPIRVVRGPKSHSPYTPQGAYRYDGVYKCTNWEFATGKTGFRVLRFTLERLEGQTPLADLPSGFEDERWVGIRDQVLAFRGMTVAQLEAQAQAAEGQVGQVKESRGSGSVAVATTTTTEGRPKRAATGQGIGKMKVEDSEDKLSDSESDSDVELVAQETKAAPSPAPPASAAFKGKAKGKATAAAEPESSPAPPSTSANAPPSRRLTRSAAASPVPESASASGSAITAGASEPRRSTRSATITSTSATTTKPAATRTSARLRCPPATSPSTDQDSDTDLPPPPPRPAHRAASASLEIALPPPPRNAHLLQRKRRHLAQQAPIAPPSSVFAHDDWAGMSRAQQAAVSARWRPVAERVFVHPLEVRVMGEEERLAVELSEWVEGGWRVVECEQEDQQRTPRARRMGKADKDEAGRAVDSGVVSSADASPRRGREWRGYGGAGSRFRDGG